MSPIGAGSRRPTAASRYASGCRSGSGGGSPISCARRPARRCSAARPQGRWRRPARIAAERTARSRAGRRACRQGLPRRRPRHGVTLIRVEDGFIRSVGLGSDFLPPASLVFDASGMYFDPRGGSDLECLLRDGDFSPALLARAERLSDAARRTRHHQVQPGARRSPDDRRHPAGPPAASSCRARSRTICRSVSAPARCAPISACWRGCAPRTPMPSSCTSRTPTSSPDTESARCRKPRRGASPISVVLERLDRSAAGRRRRSAHDDLARRVRGAVARASRRRLRPAVLCRLGADHGHAGRSIAAGGSAWTQLVAGALILYPALSRSADPAAVRPGNHDRAARTSGIVAGRAARARRGGCKDCCRAASPDSARCSTGVAGRPRRAGFAQRPRT